jgi:hypothetical protein
MSEWRGKQCSGPRPALAARAPRGGRAGIRCHAFRVNRFRPTSRRDRRPTTDERLAAGDDSRRAAGRPAATGNIPLTYLIKSARRRCCCLCFDPCGQSLELFGSDQQVVADSGFCRLCHFPNLCGGHAVLCGVGCVVVHQRGVGARLINSQCG